MVSDVILVSTTALGCAKFVDGNRSYLPPFCLPEPVLVGSCGLFVLITQRNKDRAETKEGFGPSVSPSQENKLISVRGNVFLSSVCPRLSESLHHFLRSYFPIEIALT